MTESRQSAFSSIVDIMKKRGSISYPIHVVMQLRVKESAYEKGIIRVHMPIPVDVPQLREGQLLDMEPVFRMVSVENYPQRTVFFNEKTEENIPFMIEIAFTNELKYIKLDRDIINREKQVFFSKEQIEKCSLLLSCDCETYGGSAADRVTAADISEEEGIKFTEEEKKQVIKLTEKYHDYFDRVRTIFDYMVDNDNSIYDSKEDNPDSRNVNFVRMCRMAGIPARWQGGLMVMPSEENYECSIEAEGTYMSEEKAFGHDWALVYMAPYGWIFVDCEFAAIAKNAGDDSMKEFYFGNIDPFRIPTALKYQGNMYPAKDYERWDMKTNYYGEAEFASRGLKRDEIESRITVFGCCK